MTWGFPQICSVRLRSWLRSSPLNAAAWALTDQGLVSGANFLTTVLVARFLAVEEFGRFAIAWLVVLLIQNLHAAAIISPLMTIGTTWPENDRPSYLGALLQQQLIFSVGAALLVYSVSIALSVAASNVDIAELALPIALIAAAVPVAELSRSICYSISHPREGFLLSAIRYSLQVIVLLIIFLWAPNRTDARDVLLIAAASAVVAGLVGAARLPPVHWSKAALSQVARQHWRFCRWLLGASALGNCRELITHVTVGAILSMADVGLLRAAQQLVFMINIPLQGLGRLATAYASDAYSRGGGPALYRVVRTFILPYMTMITIILFSIVPLSDMLVHFMFGAAYADSAPLVSAFSLIMLLYLIRDVLFIVGRAVYQPSWEFIALGMGAFASLPLLIPLLDRYGVFGALWAEAVFLATSLLTTAISAIAWRRRLRATISGGSQRD